MPDFSVESEKGCTGAEAGVRERAEQLAPLITTTQLAEIKRAAENDLVVDREGREMSIELCKAVMRNGRCNSRTKLMAVKALAVLDAQKLRYAIHSEQLDAAAGIVRLKMARAEEGLPNDLLAVRVAPAEELPLPATMLAYRRRILEPSDS